MLCQNYFKMPSSSLLKPPVRHYLVNFAFDIDEKVWTLLSFDIINMDRKNVSFNL